MVQSEWNNGLCVVFRITNGNNTSTRNWKLRFAPNQATITQTWNASFVQQGSLYEVTPVADWAKNIQPNQTIQVGYCASKPNGAIAIPTQVAIANL